MPNVYTDKVVIQIDKINEYFELVAKEEEARKPFKDNLDNLNIEFAEYLAESYSEKTAKKHSSIIVMFIEFISRYTDVSCIEEITKGMANTSFRQWYKRKVWDSSTPNDLKIAVNKFFKFLAEEKNIINKNVLEIKKK